MGTQLGKLAEKLGKPYKLQDFDTTRDLREHVLKELEDLGLKPSKTVTESRIDETCSVELSLLQANRQRYASHEAQVGEIEASNPFKRT